MTRVLPLPGVIALLVVFVALLLGSWLKFMFDLGRRDRERRGPPAHER